MVRRRRRELEAQDDSPAGHDAADGPCPHCGARNAIAFDTMHPTRGARAELSMMPICLACGMVVDLSPPGPEMGTCVRCGSAVYWEVRDPRDGFVPICARHGVTKVHQAAEPRRESRPVTFAPPGLNMETTGRRRGLTQADVVGAVRLPKPAQPRYQAPVDPRNFGCA
jgi:hypothetical protein